MNKQELLIDLLKKSSSLPYLFIGSGFSRRYYNTPTWEGLLKHIASLISDDEFYYSSLEKKISRCYDKKKQYNLYMAAICDELEKKLEDIWYNDEKFKENRTLYKDEVINFNYSPIKIEIAQHLKTFNVINSEVEGELDILKETENKSIAGIITTNYDDLLENIFDFNVYRSQEELLFNTNYGINELYKIHGCISDPNTILINSRDYKTIEEKHKYVTSKLLTIFIEHPIIFIGYSIGDEDIKNILYDITLCLDENKVKSIENRFFFVNWSPLESDMQISPHTLSLNDKEITITKITLSDFSKLYEIIKKNKRKYPVKLLRNIKENIYELTLNSQAKDKMLVSIPDGQNTYEDVEFVVGFGVIEIATKGYTSPKSHEIFEDIILDNGNYEPNSLLKYSFISIEKSNNILPIFKYYNKSNVDTKKIFQERIQNITSVNNFKSNRYISNKEIITESISNLCTFNIPDSSNWSQTKRTQFDKKIRSIIQIITDSTTKNDMDTVKNFIRKLLDNNPGCLNSNSSLFNKTEVKRLIRIIDYFYYK